MQHLGGLLGSQPAEVAEFDDPGLAWVKFCKRRNGIVERDEIDSSRASPKQRLLEWNSDRIPTVLGETMSPRMIDDDAPDDLGAKGEEMLAVGATDARRGNQP